MDFVVLCNYLPEFGTVTDIEVDNKRYKLNILFHNRVTNCIASKSRNQRAATTVTESKVYCSHFVQKESGPLKHQCQSSTN